MKDLKENDLQNFPTEDINLAASTPEKPTYRFIEDPGHGWLEVPLAEVIKSGAEITPYSYFEPETSMVYLEEDLDCFTFLTKAGLIEPDPSGGEYSFLRHYTEVNVYQENTFVRSLPSFQSGQH